MSVYSKVLCQLILNFANMWAMWRCCLKEAVFKIFFGNGNITQIYIFYILTPPHQNLTTFQLNSVFLKRRTDMTTQHNVSKPYITASEIVFKKQFAI